LEISSSNSSKVDLIYFQDKLTRFEHWIFVSTDFDFSSFEIKTDQSKTIFIILEKLITEIYQTYDWKTYKENKVLKSVLILYPLKIIGNQCFSCCSSLQSNYFPNTLTSLGNGCFYCCSSLQSISLPNSLASLGNGCFSCCSSLQSIKFSQKIQKIPFCCFYNCENFSYIFIPKYVVSIHSTAF
jgi:hypothetical protein